MEDFCSSAIASFEPRDYRVVFVIQKEGVGQQIPGTFSIKLRRRMDAEMKRAQLRGSIDLVRQGMIYRLISLRQFGVFFGFSLNI